MTLVLQLSEAGDAEQMRGILPPSVTARSLSGSTDGSASRQSSMSPGTSAPVNGQCCHVLVCSTRTLLLFLFLVNISL